MVDGTTNIMNTVFISILYLTNDNYYCYNEHYMLLKYQFKIMLSPI